MDLYGYFRSSAAYRVRIALNIKGISYQQMAVNLVNGEQCSEQYLARNSQGLVPTLCTDDGVNLSQSTAILEWLEESYPAPALYPKDNMQRAKIRAVCNTVACDIHPLNNLRVLKYLQSELGVNDEQKHRWYRHWIEEGFAAIESSLVATPYAMGNNITMADVYLVPQVFNALRFNVDMAAFPKLLACYEACNKLDAFVAAAPANQPDAN